MNCESVTAPSPFATTEVSLGRFAAAVPVGEEELAVTSEVAPAGGGGGGGAGVEGADGTVAVLLG